MRFGISDNDWARQGAVEAAFVLYTEWYSSALHEPSTATFIDYDYTGGVVAHLQLANVPDAKGAGTQLEKCSPPTILKSLTKIFSSESAALKKLEGFRRLGTYWDVSPKINSISFRVRMVLVYSAV